MEASGRTFDRYLVVDWSAGRGARGGANSVWIGEAGRRGGAIAREPPRNLPLRRQAEAWLRARLRELAARGERVLCGFDFALGYPAGLARALALEGPPPWRAIWVEWNRRVIDRQGREGNNRFAVAAALNEAVGGPLFWGCPEAESGPWLSRKGRAEAPRGLAEKRLADRLARKAQSPWKLYGSGAVGGQCLTGLPVVHRLRSDPSLREVARVWPFERRGGARIVFAEVFPTLLGALEVPEGRVRDEVQVEALSAWLAAEDDAGRLAALLEAPAALPAALRREVLEEEGWILGIAAPAAAG